MKKTLLIITLLSLAGAKAQALTISGASLSNYLINAETIGAQTGTTVQFTLDGPADVMVTIAHVTSDSDLGTLVTTLLAPGLSSGANSIFWNGLWFISPEFIRADGSFRLTISASSNSVSAQNVPLPLLSITSIDIHNVYVQPSLNADQQTAPPFTIKYYLAKDCLVMAKISNSSGTIVRTLARNAAGVGEFVDVTTTTANFLTWDGLGDDGRPVPQGIYTVSLDATDSITGDRAITRTRTIALQAVASLSTDAKKLFEDNTFIYPNPVRNGAATIQMLAVRAGASLTLRIYTLSGDLVRDEHFDNVAPGNIVSFSWDVTNQSGHKLGRGLYFYVVHEKDSEGDLQTVKKMAVLP